MKKVVFCTPTPKRPHQAYLDALEASVPLLDKAGWNHMTAFEVGSAYISHARAKLLRRALNAEADVIVYLDHDVSWEPEDLLKLIETEGDVVAGTYRYKKDEVEYMGTLLQVVETGAMIKRRSDGALRARFMPAGFLKITASCVEQFMKAYPELCCYPSHTPTIDLFNHGAWNGTWYGEDFAFCRRWTEMGGTIWAVPDLNLTHNVFNPEPGAVASYPGNLARFLDSPDEPTTSGELQ